MSDPLPVEAVTPPGPKGLPGDACRPLRRGAGHREHGGPFPLPLPEIMPIRSDCAVPWYLRQRLGRKRAQQRLYRESVIALNSLSNSACRDEAGSVSPLVSVSTSAHGFAVFGSPPCPCQGHQHWTSTRMAL